MKKWISVILALAVQSYIIVALAAGPVWQIDQGKQRLFIGGTLHVLAPSDYPLPAAFDIAYQQAQQIVLEVDIRELQSAETQQAMLQQLTYSDGRNLKQVLQSETYNTLEKYCASKGIPLMTMAHFKPGFLAMTLTMFELQRLGLMGTGVDTFYFQQAVQDKKSIGQLETASEQLAFLTAMGEGQEDKLILYTLQDIATIPTLMESLKKSWRVGDQVQLKKISLTPFKQQFPDVFNRLLVARNNAWIPKIENMLTTPEVEFILVGALHLVGEEGIIAMLQKKGYSIKQL